MFLRVQRPSFRRQELERGFLNAATASGEEELDSRKILARSHWRKLEHAEADDIWF